MTQKLFGRAKARLQRMLRLKKNISEEVPGPETDSDHSLVIAVTAPVKVPRLAQLRNSYRVLSTGERKLAVLALVMVLASLGAAGYAIARAHLEPTPAVGGTLSEAMVGQPKYINPLDAVANDVDRDLVRLVYSGLFRYRGLEVVPDLAKDFAWSEDRKELTVHLREAKFHDGIPLTAEDVIFTLDTLQDPTLKSPLLPLYRNIKATAPDQATVVFTLDKPDAGFLGKLDFGIMPSHLWEDLPADSLKLSDLNLKPVGSGPYKVKSFTRDSQGSILAYSLERFPEYYGEKPYIKNLDFTFYPDRDEALKAFKAGLADSLAFPNATDAAKLANQGRTDVKLSLPNITVGFFNLKRKLLASKEIRNALSLAVDRGQIADSGKITAVPVYAPFPFLEGATTTAADLDKARKILDDAGWILPPGGNVRVPAKTAKAKPETKTATSTAASASSTAATATSTPAAQPTPDELALRVVVPDETDLLNAAEALKRQWSLLGIKVEIQPMTLDEVLRVATRERSADVILLNVYLGPDQDQFPFWWSGQAAERGLNISGLSDRNVDDWLIKIRDATSAEERLQAQQGFSTTLLAANPAVFLARPIQHYLVRSRIRGVTPEVTIAKPADRLEDLTHWYIKTWWKWK